jgi:hypothetical protein
VRFSSLLYSFQLEAGRQYCLEGFVESLAPPGIDYGIETTAGDSEEQTHLS